MLSGNKAAALAMAEVMLDSEEGAISTSALRGALRRLTEVLASERDEDAPRSLIIPTIGADLTLTQDWAFTLSDEYRNSDAYTLFTGTESDGPYHTQRRADVTIVLQRGSVLRVDRVYIRKNAGEFDSLTFNLVGSPKPEWSPKSAGGTRSGKCRFWVKLTDVNTMRCDIVQPKVEEDAD